MSDPSRNRSSLDEARALLVRVPMIRTRCDLDLLVFLYRHPRMLLTSERLAEFVGYDIMEVAESLETVIEAGLLERDQHPAHAARIYLLNLRGPEDGWLSSIVELACTRSGRHDLIQALKSPPRSTPNSLGARQERRVIPIARAQ